MPFIRLRRHAPEVQQRRPVPCSLCGNPNPDQVHDHLLAGPPGLPSHDGAVCENCGRALEQTVAKLGAELSIQVEHAQREANQRDTPASSPRTRRAR